MASWGVAKELSNLVNDEPKKEHDPNFWVDLPLLTEGILQLEHGGDLQAAGVRVLRKKDRQYMAQRKTDDTPHAAFLKRVSVWLKWFKFANVVLLILSLAMLAITIYEVTTLAIYPSSKIVIGISSVLFLGSIAGLYGAGRLKQDLLDDRDGKETPAQRFVEVRPDLTRSQHAPCH